MSVQTKTRRRLHPAWLVAAVGLLALVGAAGFRAAPGVLMVPLQDEFGWPTTVLSAAVSINLLLFGLTAPFAAALMGRFGIRRVTAIALGLIGAGSALTVFVEQSWQILLTWGVLIGLGTGSMALVFAATIVDTWFVKHRGLVLGILTAGSAAGQLVFLPIIAQLAQSPGWREASLLIAAGAVAVIPLVLIFMKNKPSDVGVLPFGADALESTDALESADTPESSDTPQAGTEPKQNAALHALSVLRRASKVPTFWALVAGFAICGATTNGLIGTHFIPSAHDHGMPETTAAGLLAVVGVFDIVGTIASGWLTDRFNPKILLALYYQFRGIGLLVLPLLLSATVQPSMVIFVVIYGLDWVATVPPTAAICRRVFGSDGSIVFGWVFAAHQVGAAIAATLAGVVRDATGQYTYAWFGAAALCTMAAVISATMRKDRKPGSVPVPS
ncbi:MFS family permease [Psychromicrobium silvestre]|uniref:MFS family permease n=1 Tax=Psychromicrobium silvestre TaxID=1645614 RepID=A0A7Y9LTN1_9MICC|nr:MFS transporter [Psychromicrobium silvestre]NYE95372.1 MFS family permease [Psychromicrobium silvestre]